MMPGRAAPPGTPEPGFGVYVHWPFCKAKCPYCDFNSHVRHSSIDAAGFAAALVRELEHMAGRTPGRTVASVFFGGGTPSLMPPAAVGRVLDAVGRLWPVAAAAEVTLEANPTSAEARNFAGYRAAGVNRLSVGVQALDDADLQGLGRRHTAREALEAFRLAARTFPRASFDLIYARPRQTPEGWRRELARAIGEAAGHLSLYQLTLEPGTRFAELHARGRLAVPDEEESLALYEIAQELCAAAGLAAYEVSNHARPGEESRHNLLYWRYGEYAGVGPGAHSRLLDRGRRIALVTLAEPEAWRAAVARRGHAIAEETPLSDRQAADEMLLMGLRLSEGLDLARLASETGHAPDAAARAVLADAGLVATAPPRLMATARGRLLLDAVIAELASALAPVTP